MSTAFLGVDIVDIGENVLAVGIAILHCNLNDNSVLFTLQINRLRIDFILILIHKFNVLDNTAGKMEGFTLILGTFIGQGNRDALIQKGQLANTQTQSIIAVFRFCKNGGIRFEMYRGTRSFAITLFIKLFRGFALSKLNAVAFAAAAHFNLHVLAQCVNAGNTDTMQTAGNLITAVTELTACMQYCHNNLNSRLLFLFHHIHGNATAVIDNRNAVILMDNYFDITAVAGQSLVNTVVHNLIHQMVQTAGGRTADIHRRSFAYSLQAL